MTTWNAVLQFDTDEPEFRRGVEVGVVWEALKHEPDEFIAYAHFDCAEMFMRIGESLGRRVMLTTREHSALTCFSFAAVQSEARDAP